MDRHTFFHLGRALARLLVFIILFFITGCSFIANTTDCFLNYVSEEPFPIESRDGFDPCKKSGPMPAYNHRITSEKAAKLHKELFIADLHADTLIWRKDILKKHDYGHVDIPRLIEGNIALQVFSVFTKVPFPGKRIFSSPRWAEFFSKHSPDVTTLLTILQYDDDRTRGTLKDRALFYADKLHKAAERSEGKLAVIESQADLRAYLKNRAETPNITAGILSLEGAHALEGDPNNIEAFFKAGYRMMSLTHFYDNEFAGSSTGSERTGLSIKGKELIRLMGMDKHKMILDLSHASQDTIDEVFKLYTEQKFIMPALVVSHNGVSHITKQGELCTRKGRNLSDEHIKKIVLHEGLIGIGLYNSAVCDEALDGSIMAIKHTMKVGQTVNRVEDGAESIALGSDFDGAVTAHFDVRGMPLLTQALLDMENNLSIQQVKKIMGENVKEFFLKHLPNP